MTFSQRISPSLSETSYRQQAQDCGQGGFTLVELMVVLAILAVLLGIATGSWQEVQAKQQVDAAASKIRSAMVAARIKAMTTGKTQYVGIDIAGDRVASTVYDDAHANAYDAPTDTWGTITWEVLENVDVQESSAAGVPTGTQPSVLTFKFTSRGTVSTTGSTYSLLVTSRRAGVMHKLVMTVSNVTGRVQVKQI